MKVSFPFSRKIKFQFHERSPQRRLGQEKRMDARENSSLKKNGGVGVGSRVKVPQSQTKQNRKRNNFISFILKRRSKIYSRDREHNHRLLGQRNSAPAEFSGVGTRSDGKKGKQWF